MARKTHGPFEALSDPTRRAILRQLRKGSKTAGEIAAAFDLTKPTLSHHFRVLRAAGLVRAEKRGTNVVYALQTGVLEDIATEILELTGVGVTSGGSRQKKAKKEGTS
jgi:ArsR family transcriptional regulator, arsenate/arsenite/antimonite-responsive transcriptional repressor